MACSCRRVSCDVCSVKRNPLLEQGRRETPFAWVWFCSLAVLFCHGHVFVPRAPWGAAPSLLSSKHTIDECSFLFLFFSGQRLRSSPRVYQGGDRGHLRRDAAGGVHPLEDRHPLRPDQHKVSSQTRVGISLVRGNGGVGDSTAFVVCGIQRRFDPFPPSTGLDGALNLPAFGGPRANDWNKKEVNDSDAYARYHQVLTVPMLAAASLAGSVFSNRFPRHIRAVRLSFSRMHQGPPDSPCVCCFKAM